jgi:tetratricopeptide (TPR) repeat protein
VSRAAIALIVVVMAIVSGLGFWALDEREGAPPSPPPQAEAPDPAPRPDAAAAQRALEADYERCMELALQDPEATVAVARRWRLEGGGGDAALHCEATARMRAGDAPGAADLLERLGREGFAPREARVALLAQAGQLWLEAGEIDRAYAAATLALVLRPDDPDLLTDRAVIAASAGRLEEAIEDLTRTIDLRPDRADAYVLRASAWRQSGQPALARDDLARALAREPTNQEALLERGLLKRDAADIAGARADWEQAVRLGPDTATAALAARHIAILGERNDAALPTPPPSPPQPAPAQPAQPRRR